MGLLGKLFGSEGNKYNSDWFSSASDDELSEERERVRLDYSRADTLERANELYEALARFEEEMSKRAWGDETPHASLPHREHGWNLLKDDDE